VVYDEVIVAVVGTEAVDLWARVSGRPRRGSRSLTWWSLDNVMETLDVRRRGSRLRGFDSVEEGTDSYPESRRESLSLSWS
jgi:hypothetical protein